MDKKVTTSVSQISVRRAAAGRGYQEVILHWEKALDFESHV